MTMPDATVKAFNSGVQSKTDFKQGYVKGMWISPTHLTNDALGGLPVNLRQVILKHNENADLFVVYSYSTPIAWFSLKDSSSKGTGKWYFPTVRYSEQMDQHQHQMRYLFQLVIPANKVVKLLPNGKQMKE